MSRRYATIEERNLIMDKWMDKCLFWYTHTNMYSYTQNYLWHLEIIYHEYNVFLQNCNQNNIRKKSKQFLFILALCPMMGQVIGRPIFAL